MGASGTPRHTPVLVALFAGQALGVVLVSLNGLGALLNLMYAIFGFLVVFEVAWLLELRAAKKALAAANSADPIPGGASR